MKWKQLPVGPIQTNCYILWNHEKDCLIFDPGAEFERLHAFIGENALNPLAVLLTHAHFDHIGALDAVRDAYKIPAYIHQKEEMWLGDPGQNGSHFFGMGEISARGAEKLIAGEDMLKIGSFSLQVLETPGHSPGSVSYWLPDHNIVFSGDALFFGSIGRTDLPGGNHGVLQESIHTKLLVLHPDTIVFPGHGPQTTIGDEKSSNPFLGG
ncbi:MBL fold metallo-hydrolase [Heyndrickxia coagulans]|uniref:MBL fold metallo-hydrolase n=1 Tax=Heyndrickxia coagulans TaxID=1398 RepID=UPI00034A14C3|nr:MBL fold metallo-hydrolase [Heyndrickxia coagulans]